MIPARQFRTITILDAIDADAEGDLETAYTLTTAEAYDLAYALARGYVALRVHVKTANTGSPSATLDSLQFTVDGTNYRDLHSLSAALQLGSGVGEYKGEQITTKTFNYAAAKIKCLVTVSQLTASTHVINDLTIALVCVA